MRNYIRRWFYNWHTSSRLRIMLQYGWCPLCNSSPPKNECAVCEGRVNYGSGIVDLSVMERWAFHYVDYRRREWAKQ